MSRRFEPAGTASAVFGSVQVEDFPEFSTDRRLIRLGLHDVRHVIPPFFHDLFFRQGIRGIRIGQLLHRKQRQRLLIQKDGIVRNPRRLQFPAKFGLDRVVPLLIFFATPLEQLHLERHSPHNPSPVSFD